MNEAEKPATKPADARNPGPSLAQQALVDRKVLAEAALLHGSYYIGLFGNTKTVGRWHMRDRKFVVWIHDNGTPRIKVAGLVATGGKGEQFAPMEAMEAEDNYRISDFALETTR